MQQVSGWPQRLAIGIAVPLLCAAVLSAQEVTPQEPEPAPKNQTSQNLAQSVENTAITSSTSNDRTTEARETGKAPAEAVGGQQPKRILGIIPNYRSVSADVRLPSLSTKEKFGLAKEDTFDWGSFLLAGALAGIAEDRHSVPEFRQGAAGFGRYYWHFLADETVGNYFTEALVPALTHEDPRYYTQGHGGIGRRAGYAVSRLFITKTDSGRLGFNFSEIVGNGLAAAVSNVYYPTPERTWVKTQQKWTSQIALDGVFNVLKEFWPDISSHLTREH